MYSHVFILVTLEGHMLHIEEAYFYLFLFFSFFSFSFHAFAFVH